MSLDLGYYLQSINGHADVMRGARPIAELLAGGEIDAGLRAKLVAVTRLRMFAIRELGLPDNGSYTRYADLGRPAVLWNVVAAPELSLKLDEWCFPVAGCISYRGYYDQADAEGFARRLEERGRDVFVAPVPAYSTLGWFDDPVLNTFLRLPDLEVARLLFHELAHQVLYVKGDSAFNESFATAVEEAGVERWMAAHASPAQIEEYRRFTDRRDQFLELLRRKRADLEGLYASGADPGDLRRGKAVVLESLKDEYQVLKTRWGGWAGYDRWFARRLSNAHLGAVATYTEWVPAFRRLLVRHEGDLRAFYAAVREMASLPRPARERALAALRDDKS